MPNRSQWRLSRAWFARVSSAPRRFGKHLSISAWTLKRSIPRSPDITFPAFPRLNGRGERSDVSRGREVYRHRSGGSGKAWQSGSSAGRTTSVRPVFPALGSEKAHSPAALLERYLRPIQGNSNVRTVARFGNLLFSSSSVREDRYNRDMARGWESK